MGLLKPNGEVRAIISLKIQKKNASHYGAETHVYFANLSPSKNPKINIVFQTIKIFAYVAYLLFSKTIIGSSTA
jgi:hypothetical protein